MNWLKKIFSKVETQNEIFCSLENTYNALRLNNPDKDEHWLLANTWLARYGDWEASKQKGQKLTRFIAYKDTFLYSFLDNPKSIRGLILYLTYKELGDRDAEGDPEESRKIMAEILEAQEGGRLMDVYKEKNPFTWSEIEREKDESIYGLYGFLKTADYLNKNPDEQEQAMRELERLDRGDR